MSKVAAAALLSALVLGCAEGQQVQAPAPPRPFWFQMSDFTRPGHVSTWDYNDPPVSACGQMLGGLLAGAAGGRPNLPPESTPPSPKPPKVIAPDPLLGTLQGPQ
jgi:hypothetical protein